MPKQCPFGYATWFSGLSDCSVVGSMYAHYAFAWSENYVGTSGGQGVDFFPTPASQYKICAINKELLLVIVIAYTCNVE